MSCFHRRATQKVSSYPRVRKPSTGSTCAQQTHTHSANGTFVCCRLVKAFRRPPPPALPLPAAPVNTTWDCRPGCRASRNASPPFLTTVGSRCECIGMHAMENNDNIEPPPPDPSPRGGSPRSHRSADVVGQRCHRREQHHEDVNLEWLTSSAQDDLLRFVWTSRTSRTSDR